MQCACARNRLSDTAPLALVRRPKHAHWTITPAAAADADVDILSVQKTQQWETPPQVWEYVSARWAVDFDACASPINALAPRYSTVDDDFLAREDLKDITIYCNPPYALDRYGTGSCAAIEPFVRRLVELASTRGCTCIALVPVLSHQLWFHTCVTGAASGGRAAHEIHWVQGLLKWNNPFHEREPASPYIYPFALCVWRPGAPPDRAHEVVASLPRPSDDVSRSFHFRRCRRRGCGKVRLLPRHVDLLRA
ncbi:hypothetical protein EMIHUDRAFT_111979 [Emiliania huxleyi CCMP1516]|uniref:Uncharacterized protein n=2 Tax=Emiliania huxleyi TaxID=2903 RepID=A0A0D3KB01_EMIH1|nr:hypothetical protein EMIHUDRAFT_111979 [Emiliania huxleyi CCMP1516]EOD32936.1 hypothetical protein EMIHUDRAFT_111979 [Emiliania huxleyi CCMP1516]|eukprot:XP_005785365.1 hypothetical protein EMIHUDRAFT_111979 [Emiliania huxleyi CCMP1516]